jgi:hypothetical protein
MKIAENAAKLENEKLSFFMMKSLFVFIHWSFFCCFSAVFQFSRFRVLLEVNNRVRDCRWGNEMFETPVELLGWHEYEIFHTPKMKKSKVIKLKWWLEEKLLMGLQLNGLILCGVDSKVSNSRLAIFLQFINFIYMQLYSNQKYRFN